MSHALTIIAYDVRSNRRRRLIARAADDFGCRIQLSVFYGWLTQAQRERLKQRLQNIIDPKEDAVLIVPACERCAAQVIQMGQCRLTPIPLCWVF